MNKLVLIASMISFAIGGCARNAEQASARADSAVRRYDTTQALASNGKVMVGGTQSSAILRSQDAGRTWTRIAIQSASIIDVTSCPDGSFVALDFNHKVWQSDAQAQKWTAHDLEKPRNPVALTCDAHNAWWVVGSRSQVAHSTDAGVHWSVSDLGEDAQITAIHFFEQGRGLLLGEFGLVAKTHDGGATWQKLPAIAGEFYPYAAVFANAEEGWVSGLAGQMLRTVDGGHSWSAEVNTTQAPLYRLMLVNGVPHGVGASGVVAKREGAQWVAVTYPDAVPAFLGAGAQQNGQIVIGGPGGLLRSLGGQATVAPSEPVLPNGKQS